MKWFSNNKCDDVVLSTRVRLARNIAQYAFTPKLTEEVRSRMIKDVRNVFEKFGSERYNYVDMTTKKLVEKSALVEEHLISREFAAMPDSEKRMLVYDENGKVSVMVGEEDHLRIQSVYPGFCVEDAYKSAKNIDDMLSRGLEFAFDEKLGYLTCCPSNTGTGMRVSCMLHLPMLTRNNYIKAIIEFCTRMGLTVRGFYGEGSGADGEIYQVSNQVTLGISEEDTLKRLADAVSVITEKEKELRSKITKSEVVFADKLWRSYGILKNARKIASSEFLSLWSDCLLAKNCGIINELCDINMVQLLVECMPAHIMLMCECAEDALSRDVIRAEKIRNYLK